MNAGKANIFRTVKAFKILNPKTTEKLERTEKENLMKKKKREVREKLCPSAE